MPTVHPGLHYATGPIPLMTWCGFRLHVRTNGPVGPISGPPLWTWIISKTSSAGCGPTCSLISCGRPERRGSLRTRLALFQVRLNGNDWHRFQRSVATQAERVVIASELDAARSGLSNVTVIPNTYPRPQSPIGDPAAEKPPVLLFQGNLGYPPNIDAAQWLATEIAPLIRASEPATELRLVGRPGANVSQLHRPGVLTVVGEVPTMDNELARAVVAVVPIRYGSGTRIKILESFAHRIPVVSTTLGAEGLEVEDDVHLLLADEPAAFAAATVRLLGDPRLRQRLTQAAEALYLDRYDGRLADQDVCRLVEEVARTSTRS